MRRFLMISTSLMVVVGGASAAIVLDNNDDTNTDTKTWTISALNDVPPSVSGNAAVVTGTLAGAGDFGPSESFSLTASSVIGWLAVDAKAALAAGAMEGYLGGLTAGKVDGRSDGELGADSTSVYPDDNKNTLTLDSREALVYTLDASGLGTNSHVWLKNVLFQHYAADRTDFIVYDVSADLPITVKWDHNFEVDDSASGNWIMEDGDLIIIAAGASNGLDDFRVDTFTLDVTVGDPALSSWRVIPEDPDYPTDDIIVAYCEVTDAAYNLPADPANTDCAAAFQAAIDDASGAGGGTVFVPAGEYRFDNNLTIPAGVTLRGRWDRPAASGWNTGSVLKIYHGENNPDATAFISVLGKNSAIKELNFWHPNQSYTSVKPYPFVILGENGTQTYEKLTMVNAYRGLSLPSSGMCVIREYYGTMLETGLMADNGGAVPRFDSLYSGPQYWEWWPLDDAVADAGQAGNYAYEMLDSGIFFRMLDQDTYTLYCAEISGYFIGIRMEQTLEGFPNNGEVSDLNIHDCKTALLVENGTVSAGVRSTFSGSDYGIYSEVDGVIQLSDSSVSGGIYAAYSVLGGDFALIAKNCEIDGEVRFDGGTLNLKACNFTNSATQVSVTSGIREGFVWGCTYNGTPGITIDGATYLNVDHTPLNYKHVPEYGVNPLTDWNTVRKPAKADLFNVRHYGANGYGFVDDTAAVVAAIDAAKANGGGIVFFPWGQYRITENLDLGTGIELRGIGTRGHIGTAWQGLSVILVDKSGPADGTPFITMGDGCGIRGGMTFFYKGNNWERILNQGGDFEPYPFTVYANGTNNYMIGCTSPNPYQFVDFDGATDPLVDMTLNGGLRRGYRVRGGTTGCRITTGHVKPAGMWGTLADLQDSVENRERLKILTAATMEIFDLDDCEDVTVAGIFGRAANKLMSCDGASGRAVGVAGEELQNGFWFESAGSSPFYLIDTKPNPGQLGDLTGKSAITLAPTFTGTQEIYGGAEQGSADYKFNISSGNLYVQERRNVNSGLKQLREIRVGGDARVTLYDNIIDRPWTIAVESNAVLKLDHSNLPEGIPYAPIEGTLILEKCAINENLIMSVPGQTQFTEHGIKLDTSNTERLKRQKSWYELLTSGTSFNLDVTEPAFQDGKVGDVQIEVGFYPDQISNISIYYDSASGEKLGKFAAIPAYDDVDKLIRLSFRVTDARFGSTNSDIRVETDLPEGTGLTFVSVRGNPAFEPPFDLTATAGGASGTIELDWKGMSHWRFDHYNVYRSETQGGSYAPIATGIYRTGGGDSNLVNGTAYYYVVTAVDSSGAESDYSNEVMISPTDVEDNTPPAPPENLMAIAQDGAVSLDWDDNAEADLAGYSVYRATTSNSYGSALAEAVGESAYTDETAINGTTYYYVVTATDINTNESGFSTEAFATPTDGLVVPLQHLDASSSTNVIGDPVSQWTDLSGNGNHATPAAGSVYTSGANGLASGLSGLDFGTNKNSLTLFTDTESDSWLDQTDGNGFCVLIAFKCDGLVDNWNDLIGNSTSTGSGFALRYSKIGAIQAYLGGVSMNKGSASIAVGDTVVYAFNYDQASGEFELWDSINNNSETNTVPAGDFSLADAVTLGGMTSGNRYFNGLVGEVKIFDTVLAPAKFQSERDALVHKWSVVAPNNDPYGDWVVAYGGTNVIGASTNDYDGDGLANLAEYALGGNPTNTLDVGISPTLSYVTGDLIYIHAQRADDTNLLYTVKSRTNLISGAWDTADYTILGTNFLGTNTLGDVLNEVSNKVNSVIDDSLYLRLIMQNSILEDFKR